jgi:hypothetical protein
MIGFRLVALSLFIALACYAPIMAVQPKAWKYPGRVLFLSSSQNGSQTLKIILRSLVRLSSNPILGKAQTKNPQVERQGI